MDPDLADLEDLALTRIRPPEVVLPEAGRVLARPESLLAPVQGAVSGRHDVALVDERPAAPELGAFGAVEVNGRHPGPSTRLGQLSAHHSEGGGLDLTASTC